MMRSLDMTRSSYQRVLFDRKEEIDETVVLNDKNSAMTEEDGPYYVRDYF